MRAVLIALVIAAAASCRQGTPTPFDFAREWAAVDALADEAARSAQGQALATRWRGKRYRWTGYALAGLCVQAQKKCSINPFQRPKTASPERLGGMFPLITFNDAGWAALKQRCQGRETCLVTFEGLLTEVRTDIDEMLALTFEDASVVDARATTEADTYWDAPRKSATQQRALHVRPEDAVVSKLVVKPAVF
jgi:hypothetical protein